MACTPLAYNDVFWSVLNISFPAPRQKVNMYVIILKFSFWYTIRIKCIKFINPSRIFESISSFFGLGQNSLENILRLENSQTYYTMAVGSREYSQGLYNIYEQCITKPIRFEAIWASTDSTKERISKNKKHLEVNLGSNPLSSQLNPLQRIFRPVPFLTLQNHKTRVGVLPVSCVHQLPHCKHQHSCLRQGWGVTFLLADFLIYWYLEDFFHSIFFVNNVDKKAIFWGGGGGQDQVGGGTFLLADFLIYWYLEDFIFPLHIFVNNVDKKAIFYAMNLTIFNT